MWLAIEGLIGAGKTTTVELVAAQSNLAAVIERSDDHPFLSAYYRDPGRYAVETELAFMLLQAHQIRDVDPEAGIVSDYAPAKNWIFARENCTDEQLAFLTDVEKQLWSGLPRPDSVFFLDVPPERCLERIVFRGRDYEQGLGAEDLTRLRDGYLDSLRELGKEVETICLDGTETREDVAAIVIEAAGL